jgi:hypothetical protein
VIDLLIFILFSPFVLLRLAICGRAIEEGHIDIDTLQISERGNVQPKGDS